MKKTEPKVCIISGTKAQLIKMAPIMKELTDRDIGYGFIWTGQHKETIDEILDNFGIKKPDSKLYKGEEIKSPLKGIFWFSSLMLRSMFKGKSKRVNGIVLIHGDAVSALIGLVYGRAMGYQIGHVEAGLRSFNFFRPFPEEIVRYIVSFFTDFHFAPGDWAAGNLKNRKGEIVNTKMNTLIDALMYVKGKKAATGGKYALVNLHRFENIQNKKRFSELVDLIVEISGKIKVYFIMHPTTEYQITKFGFLEKLKNADNIILNPRLSYVNFASLFSNSEFLITDGGSNQEETSYLGHPCLLLRKETERIEGLNESVMISSYDKDKVLYFVDNYEKFRKEPIKFKESPSKIIVDFLIKKSFCAGKKEEGILVESY